MFLHLQDLQHLRLLLGKQLSQEFNHLESIFPFFFLFFFMYLKTYPHLTTVHSEFLSSQNDSFSVDYVFVWKHREKGCGIFCNISTRGRVGMLIGLRSMGNVFEMPIQCQIGAVSEWE
jgi:hypothetical protein